MRVLVILAIAAATLVPGSVEAGTISASDPSARACFLDPNALTDREMIRRNRTGERVHPVMFLGRVIELKDVGGKPKGKTIAKLAVAEHPVGFAPLISRVHFYRPQKGEGVPSELFTLERRTSYVVVADRRRDGTFDIQLICAHSHSVSGRQFRALVRLARAQ